jgi:Co/Zn/Cd efflux system component
MFIFGIGVLAEAVYKIVHPVLPNAETMGVIGVLALAANAVCFLVLYSHREDNLNMSSTWLCTRNDLLADVGVLVAAASSYLFSSQWPDVIVGLSIAVLFVYSAGGILAQSVRAWRTA